MSAGRGLRARGGEVRGARCQGRTSGGELLLRNRQRTRRVNLRLLQEIVQDLLTCDFPHRRVELGIHLVAAPEMIRLNEQFLSHAGSTDVITFDHADSAGQASSPVPTNTVGPARDRQDAGPVLWGEIFICLDDAVAQARRFRTTWQSEVARYLIHGLLHLHGYDDQRPAARLKMKREENRLLREVSRRFALGRLARRPRLSKGKVQL